MQNQKNLEKELLQAVIVVDDFEGIFSGFTEDETSALLPIVSVRVIDYALECLGQCGFQEAIVFCASNARVIRQHLESSPWNRVSSTMKVTLLVSEKCQSLGDALRDIDNKAIIKGSFVLLSAFTISNINLINVLNYHGQLLHKDKGTAMTLVLQDIGSRNSVDSSIYIMNAITNQLLMHIKFAKLKKKIEMPVEYITGNINVNIFSNLYDTGIAICSPSVPLLFSDNFDFQTKEDFIRGILLNEEILNSRIYCYQVENGYASTIKTWQMFQKVYMDCIHRWSFPLVPDQFFMNEKPFSYFMNCIYKQPGVQLMKGVKLEMDVAIGTNSQIGENTKILRSVIGKNCCIGKNVTIRDSYLFDNCIIEDHSVIEVCVLGDNVKVQENSMLKNCLLKKNVLLNSKSHVQDALVFATCQDEKSKKLSDSAYLLKIDAERFPSKEYSFPNYMFQLFDPEVECQEIYEEDDISSFSDGEKSYMQSPEPDDATLFYMEVVDSLQRGFEEKLSCENLILEINSSRYAYNVMLSDVTKLTLKGILLLPSKVKSSMKPVLSYFLPLLQNYVKNSEAQANCLELLEDICDELGNEVAKCLHFLYDNDIITEDSILKWYDCLEKGSLIFMKVAPLVKWLNEAAEESTEDSDS